MPPAEDRQHPLVATRDPSPAEPRAREPRPRLGLTWLEKMAATAAADGGDEAMVDLIELVRACAEALAGDDATGARRRLLSRELAIAKVTLDTMTASVGTCLRANNERAAILADRFATAAARRLVMIASEHRASFGAEKRMVVAVGHADVVQIDGGE